MNAVQYGFIQTIIFLVRKAALKRGIIHQLRVFSESHHIHSPFYRLRYKLMNPAVLIMRQIVSEQFCEVDRHWLVFHYCMFQNAITVLMFSADIYAHVRRLLQQQPLVQSILPNTFSCGKPEVRPPRQFLCLPL